MSCVQRVIHSLFSQVLNSALTSLCNSATCYNVVNITETAFSIRQETIVVIMHRPLTDRPTNQPTNQPTIKGEVFLEKLLVAQLDKKFPAFYGWKSGIFLFTITSGTALGPIQSPIQQVPGDPSLGVKRPGRKARHSPPYSAKVKE